jgi:hypothetical protein
MSRRTKQLLAGCIAMISSGAAAGCFWMMWYQGCVKACEPWLWMRVLETAVSTILFLASAWLVFDAAKISRK